MAKKKPDAVASVTLRFRCTPSEAAIIRVALGGKDFSEWARETLLKAARDKRKK